MGDKLMEHIMSCEDEALELNDLKTAIHLNWLRNAVLQGMDPEDAMYKWFQITRCGGFVDDEEYF